MYTQPLTMKKRSKRDVDGKMVVKKTEIVFSETDDQIIASDKNFNQNFNIEHVR
jgi:hypothetical protein